VSGRYAKELSALGLTYQAATAWDVSSLARPLEGALKRPMAVIGSGGSFSVATYCARLHRQLTGELAQALTPLSFLDTSLNTDTALLCVSASGRNADILAAFARGMEDELRPAIAFTLDPDAPLVVLAANVGYADSVIGPDLAEPDGFLAVNSLLATCLCFARAYRSVAGETDPFPSDYSTFLSNTLQSRSLEGIAEEVRHWNGRRTISVLYSPELEAAAIDLESRFVEAALGPLHVADFRNFGHGRHNWLAKRASETGVVSIGSDKQKKLAERTLKLLPPETGVSRIDIAGDPDVAGLAALIVSLYVSAGAGRAIDVDPGRPGVPEFGRKLYRLPPPQAPARNLSRSTIRKIAAIKRVGGHISSELVETASETHVALLEQAAISAIALDYDGTICDPRHRFNPLPDSMAAALRRVNWTCRLVSPPVVANPSPKNFVARCRRSIGLGSSLASTMGPKSQCLQISTHLGPA
jgi:fructoselysine-6-P-deglycase FrlB-like protein